MSEFVGKMQSGIKNTSSQIGLFTLKLLSGGVLGLTFALIMQEILGKGEGENLLAFFFVIVTTAAVFLRIAKTWGLTAILIFDLICILLGMVLRMYIMVAPNG